MRLSYLVYALTLIVFALVNLGIAFTMAWVWWMLIVATVLWILEGLALGLPTVSIRDYRRRPTA